MKRFDFSSLSFKKPKLLTLDEKYIEAKKQLIVWLDNAFGDVGVDWNNYIVDVISDLSKEKNKFFRAYVFLGHCRYLISVHIYENRKSYLGCIMNSTRYLVGEDWMRGSDLSDGEFNRDTFDKIIRDILRTQFRKVETTDGKVQVGNRTSRTINMANQEDDENG